MVVSASILVELLPFRDSLRKSSGSLVGDALAMDFLMVDDVVLMNDTSLAWRCG